MTGLDLQALMAPVTELAVGAGERILEVYRGSFAVDLKADNSPLTAADRAAHRHIVDGLGRLAADIPLLSEEGDIAPFSERRHWTRYWLIDPLDGTREFVKRNGEFTVNIALIENHQPVLGVVHAPVAGVTWFAARGCGARKRSAEDERPIAARPLGGPMTAVVSRSHRGERVDALLERLPVVQTVSVGSSLKFCLLAEGKADLYPRFGPTSEWDTAAAHCVLEAAGGKVTKLDLTPLRYNTKDSLLNPDFLAFGDPSHDWSHYLEDLHGEDR